MSAFTGNDDPMGEHADHYLSAERYPDCEACRESVRACAVDALGRDHRSTETINGCEVIYRNGIAAVIQHPAGFMVYAGWRVATLKTLRGAIRRADLEASR